jgi:dual-specificity kinase
LIFLTIDFSVADKVIQLAGIGTFGKVYLCNDLETNRIVAVKVVRQITKYVEAAKVEARILNDIREADHSSISNCVHYYHSFDHLGYFCMVFEALGISLYELVKKNDYQPFPLNLLQQVADQLCHAVAFLHSMRLIHTDLKLENILFVSRDPFVKKRCMVSSRQLLELSIPQYCNIRVIDFGGSTYDWERKGGVINTRQYRAPEVIMDLSWSLKSDVWSLGCILMELYVGELLFQTHDTSEHLALMSAILGPIPTSFVLHKRTRAIKKYFNEDGSIRYPRNDTPAESIQFVRNSKTLRQLIRSEDSVFYDLISSMLQYDPSKRCSAREALDHPFFTQIRGVSRKRSRSKI